MQNIYSGSICTRGVQYVYKATKISPRAIRLILFMSCTSCAKNCTTISFRQWRRIKDHLLFTIEDLSSLKANYEGTADLVFRTKFVKYHVLLQKVLYMPSWTVNLISVSKATSCGYRTKLGVDYCEIYKVGNGEVALKLKRTGHS